MSEEERRRKQELEAEENEAFEDTREASDF